MSDSRIGKTEFEHVDTYPLVGTVERDPEIRTRHHTAINPCRGS